MTRRRKVTRAPQDGAKRRGLLGSLGPGLITGAADDDPSGIATYSQAGAQFGYALAWSLALTYPLMVAVQEVSARIGRTTGRGIAGNVRDHHPHWLYPIVALLFGANVCNIGADLAAMGAAAQLILPSVASWIYLLLFAAICAGGPVYFSHARYTALLKWLTWVLFAYFGALLLSDVEWSTFLKAMVWPSVPGGAEGWFQLLAIFGTTISPYLFFWQAGQEAEDVRVIPERRPLHAAPGQASDAFGRIHLDTIVGMGISNLVGVAILATAAATLHREGATHIESAAQAAQALRPVAGSFAFALFALGIVGTGLMSVPVLAGSAAYAVGEARRWPVGLARKPRQAKAFYITLGVATLLGVAANLARVNPLLALIWSAVLNAVVSVPVMVLIMIMSGDSKIMGKFPIPRWQRALGWLTTGLMTMGSVAYIATRLS